MNIKSGNANRLLHGTFLCAFCISLNGYAQGEKPASKSKPASNDQIVELTKQIAILTKHSEDSEKNNEQTFARIQAQIAQLQTQIGSQFGAQVQQIASTSGQYITIVSILFGTVSLGTAIYFSILGYLSRKDFQVYANDMRTDIRSDLEEQTSRLDRETETFRNQIRDNQIILSELQLFKKELKRADVLEAEIKEAVNEKYQPPGELKRDIIELLLYNHEFSQEFQTLLQDELRRIGGNQPPTRQSAQSQTDETGSDKL
jgi:hypothetical protein